MSGSVRRWVRGWRAVGPAGPDRVHAATSDCERVRPGLIGQPANTVSSLAFVAAAVPVWRASREPGRGAWAGVAAALAVEGLGSVGYHGPGGHRSKLVHDAGLLALTGALGAACATDRAVRPLRPLPLGLGVAAAALHALSRTGGPLCGCDRRVQGHAVFHVLAAAAVVSAAGWAGARRRPTMRGGGPGAGTVRPGEGESLLAG